MKQPPASILPRWVLICTVVTVTGTAQSGNVLTVCDDGCDFTTIRSAVTAAETGDTVEVGAGLYTESVFVGWYKPLTIRGAGAGSTILDAWGYSTGVTLLGASTLSHMTVEGAGYGVVVSGAAGIRNCVVQDTAVGVVAFASQDRQSGPRIADTTIRLNRYGLINDAASVEIDRSLLTANEVGLVAVASCTADPGDGDASVVLRESTLSGNEIALWADASGMCHPAPIPDARTWTSIAGSTIAFNDRAVLTGQGINDLAVAGSILAHNGNEACVQVDESGGYNLLSGDLCTAGDATDITGVDPGLLPLADNGGPGRTHALPPGSPAVDAAGPACAEFDQRGVERPIDGDGDGIAECDIGAFEYVPPDPVELLEGMASKVTGLQLHHGTESALLAGIRAARRVLTDSTGGNDHAAVHILEALVRRIEAHSGKKIREEDAAALAAQAREIIDSL